MAALNVTDLNNAKADVDHIDDLANSTSPTATNRYGVAKTTVAGAIDSLKAFNSRGAWAPSTVYAIKDLVSNGGFWYVCVVAHTSSAAFATDTASKWRIHQGLTAPDLAVGTAAAGLGFTEYSPDSQTTTAQDALRELVQLQPTALFPNVGTVANRNCTILGDSISHGAFALNTFLHGWARLFARAFNAELSTTSYGFVNLGSLGSGGTATSDIHAVGFSGTAWTGVDASTSSEAASYPAGMAYRAGDATSLITITVPSFQNRAMVYFGTRPSGVNFTIHVNGVLAATVVTAGTAGYSAQEITMVDNGYGDNVITIQSTAGAVQPDIIGISYLSAAVEPVVNNFSASGRRLRYLSEALIIAMMQESSTMIIALGHNDQGSADSDNTYYADFMQRITWLTTYSKQYGVRMVVPDFCWSAARSSRTRAALRKLARDTGGIYIDMPGDLFKNRETLAAGADRFNYLVNDYKMWTDGSHPGKAGQKWIFETIAKRVGLSCTSKNDVIARHDWWIPLVLKSATSVENYFTAGNQVSATRRNGNAVLVRLFLRVNPTGAFPVGTYVLQDAWRTKAELSALQGYSGIGVVRSDTGAIISTLSVAASGSITLTVTGAWINQQDMTFSMPI